MIADSSDNLTADMVIQVLKGLGVPGAIIAILGWTCRKVFIGAGKFFVDHVWPEIVKCTDAYQNRQISVATSQEKLVNQTIDIQTKSAHKLQILVDSLPEVCKHTKCLPAPKPRPTNQDGGA